MISRESRVKISTDIVSAEIEGEITILNPRTDEYLSLNQVGSSVWRLLQEIDDLVSIHQRLMEEYAVEPEVMWVDLFDLLTEMEKAGVIEIQ
jgi:hypothetical protein